MKDTNDEWFYQARDEEDVTASDVAAFAYCAKAWHLERVLRKPVDTAAMARRITGVDRHLDHGTRLARVGRFGRGALWASATLLIVAAILLAVAMLMQFTEPT